VGYTPALIDDFDDDILDTNKWTITQSPGATESDGTLNMACVADYPRVEGSALYDLTSGILAAKLSASGTRSSGTEFYIGARDGSGNAVSALGTPLTAYVAFQPSGSATISNEEIIDTEVGVGPNWVDGTWWGIGNMGNDNVVRMYNSPDGETWYEMANCKVGGTFDKSHAGLVFMAGVWDGTTPDLVAHFDDATYWVVESLSYQKRRVRSGGVWVYATPKVRVNGEWVVASPKPKIDGEWFLPWKSDA